MVYRRVRGGTWDQPSPGFRPLLNTPWIYLRLSTVFSPFSDQEYLFFFFERRTWLIAATVLMRNLTFCQKGVQLLHIVQHPTSSECMLLLLKHF